MEAASERRMIFPTVLWKCGKFWRYELLTHSPWGVNNRLSSFQRTHLRRREVNPLGTWGATNQYPWHEAPFGMELIGLAYCRGIVRNHCVSRRVDHLAAPSVWRSDNEGTAATPVAIPLIAISRLARQGNLFIIGFNGYPRKMPSTRNLEMCSMATLFPTSMKRSA